MLNGVFSWWARQNSNLRPLPCQGSVTLFLQRADGRITENTRLISVPNRAETLLSGFNWDVTQHGFSALNLSGGVR